MNEVEIEISQDGEEVMVTVFGQSNESQFYFENESEAETWISNQNFKVIQTIFS